MKRTTIIWLIVAAALVLFGFVLFTGVMAANHWDLNMAGSEEYETRTVDITEEFENISIRTETADIAFVPSGDGKCSVVSFDRAGMQYNVSVKNKTLTVEAVDTRKWYDWAAISLSYETPKLTVNLPETAYVNLMIKESTGAVVIPEEFSFAEMSVTTSTGDVECGASSKGVCRIGSDTGDIRVADISAGDLDLSVTTGRVEVTSADCAGDLSVKVSTGRAVLKDVACRNLTSDGSTGSLTLENVTASGLFNIKRSTGGVKMEDCDAAELSITTDTGDVSGTLLSEKIFFAKSDTGRIDVPQTTSGGKCTITTDTGDISVYVR